MNKLKVPTTIEYLTNSNDFIDIVNLLFKEYIEIMEVNGLQLLQISADEKWVRAIIQVCNKEEDCKKIQEFKEIKLDQMPYLKNEVVCIKASEKSYMPENTRMLFSPVYIRDKAAMYVGAFIQEGKFEDYQYQLLSQVTLIVQSIAAKKNFEDSLESSFKLLEDLMDEIPVGVAVLDKNEKRVFLMNELAAKSEAVQNAMGTALEKYNLYGENQIEEIYENEYGLWYDVQFKNIQWINGQDVLICTAIDVTQKIKNKQRIEYQANNDYLTGLFNRMKLEKDLAEMIEKTVRNCQHGIVLFLDLDNFKQVNDGLGHQYGDVLLQEIATGIQAIPEIENSCYRQGGDEFVIIIKPEFYEKSNEILKSISRMFSKPWTLMEVEYYCTMSMGLSVFPDNGTIVQDILKKADFAMYEAKKNGKNQFLWYEDKKEDENKEQQELENMIRNAVKNDFKDFEIEYQAVVDSAGKIKGAEALLRLNTPKSRKMIPEEFIPVAEYLGLISYIGEYVMEHACKTLQQWNQECDPDFKMHINLSSIQLMSGSADENIMEIIKKYQLNPKNIVMDISENSEFRDESKALKTLNSLRAYGIQISVDDFGTGELSLNLLKKFKVNLVKIDGTFIKKMMNESFEKSVFQALMIMSQQMKFEICFEGIETQEQKNLAIHLGVDYMEGYWFGDVMNKLEFEKALKKINY